MSSVVPKGRLSLALTCACTLAAAAASMNAQTVVTTIPLAGAPEGVNLDPVAKRVYVAESTQVQVLDETTNKVVTSFNLPGAFNIDQAVPNPATGLIYVATETSLYVVDPKTFLPVAQVNVNAATVAVNPLTDTIYVSDFNTNLYVIDGKSNTIDKTIVVDGIQNVAVNPLTDRIYAAQNVFPAKVEVINGKNYEVIADPSGGGDLGYDVSVDPFHNTFASSEELGSASLYNAATNTLTGTVQLGGNPGGIRIDYLTQKVYVANGADNTVQVINPATKSVVDTVPVGVSPDFLDMDEVTGILYVANTGSNSLTVIKAR